MIPLTDKLRTLGVRLGAAGAEPPKPRSRHSIDHVVAGRTQGTPCGDAFVVETEYPAEYRHGSGALCVAADRRTVAEWAREMRVAACQPESFVFLDTETTGLAGGTGTYAFLVGVGRLEGERFRLSQYFMRDPATEPAMLAALVEYLQPDDALVTFNGKAFDAPLLNARYVTQNMASPLAHLTHLDLLPLARRLWRDRLESRRLGFLETHILGHTRAEEEVPGWLIPQMYFDYLRSGDARPLKGVFYHNAMDVVALAALFNHMCQLLSDPVGFAAEHGSDVIAVARLLEELGYAERAAELYRRGLERDLARDVSAGAVRRLSFLERRRGEVPAAVDLWRRAAEGREVYAQVALAKFYEHQTRDYSEAARWAEAALASLSADDCPDETRTRWVADVEHRLARLRKRLRAAERPGSKDKEKTRR